MRDSSTSRKIHRIWAGALVAVAATMVVGCGGNDSDSSGSSTSKGSTGAKSGEPLNVLAILDTSGPTKAYGSQELLGIQAAANFLNTKGGILGHKVNVVHKDDTGDPATSAGLAVRELSSNPGKYAMVWAGAEGRTTAALAPVLKRFDVLAAATNDGSGSCATASTCPNLFTMFGARSLPMEAMAQYFAKQGVKKVGILAEQTTFTENELGFLQKSLAKAEIQQTTVTFPASAVSVTPQMSKLKDANVDAIAALALGISAGYVLKARATLEWSAPLVFDPAGASADLTTLAPASQLAGVTETIQYCQNGANDIPAFEDLYANTPEPLIPTLPCGVAGGAWDGMIMLADAAKIANSVEPKKLISGAESIKAKNTDPDFNHLVFQAYCWTPENHENTCNQVSDFEVVPAGKIVKNRLVPAGS